MVTSSSGGEMLADAVRTASQHVLVALTSGSDDRSREDWLALAAGCQALVNTVTAAQDVAVAEAARRESVWREDGTLGESVHGPGRVTLDAADVVAPVLGVSHHQAQHRVEQAVRLAAGRLPVGTGHGEVAEASGLHGLHVWMAAGRVDGYRVGVLAHELQECPAEVAEAVVCALEPHLEDEGPTLRRRCRRLLARISPELLRRRAERARSKTGLRRWVAEPGVDAWFGTFPSEDAAVAWAAVDRLAHQLVAAGSCSSVEQARGRALTDLVTGTATVDVQVVLTVPADVCSAGSTAAPRRDEDLVEVQGARPSEPMLVRRSWLEDRGVGGGSRHLGRTDRDDGRTAPCDPGTGARVDPTDDLATSGYRPGAALTTLVRARDGRCRFPGCSVSARFCDLDHVRPWPAGPTTADNLACLCRRHHRVKQTPGWSVHLAPDGTATWSDPTGRLRTTTPLDALDAVVLVHDPVDVAAPVAIRPGSPWSALESFMAVRLDHRPGHRRCTTVVALRASSPVQRGRPSVHDPPPF